MSRLHAPSRISIHAPREGSDIWNYHPALMCHLFQSTLPARGATIGSSGYKARIKYFNPRSPRGERQPQRAPASTALIKAFQSTLPARGATLGCLPPCNAVNISIHAPREGSDSPPVTSCPVMMYFNPRSPRGERLLSLTLIAFNLLFQSTLPARGATYKNVKP